MKRHNALVSCTYCKTCKLLFFGSFWLIGFIIDWIFKTSPVFIIIFATVSYLAGFFVAIEKYKSGTKCSHSLKEYLDMIYHDLKKALKYGRNLVGGLF